MKFRMPTVVGAMTLAAVSMSACGGGNSNVSHSVRPVTSSASAAASSSASPGGSSSPQSSVPSSAPISSQPIAAQTSQAQAPKAAPMPVQTHIAVGSDGADGQITCESQGTYGPVLEARGATSCPFAESVLAAAQASPTAPTIRAYSPATHGTYIMTRNPGAIGTEYTGGSGADVWVWNGLLG